MVVYIASLLVRQPPHIIGYVAQNQLYGGMPASKNYHIFFSGFISKSLYSAEYTLHDKQSIMFAFGHISPHHYAFTYQWYIKIKLGHA